MANLLDKLCSNENLNNNELIEFVRVIKESGKLGIIQEILQNVQEEYFIQDKIHGINHNERVVVYSAYMGIKEGLSDKELKILIYSALYHDIGRKDKEQNINHGVKSAELIERNKEKFFRGLNQEEINFIKALCISHSNDDDKMQDIAKEIGIIDIKTFVKIASILKDADALDRIRLPRFGKLDTNYLRLDISKKFVSIAQKIYFESVSIYNGEENKKFDVRLEDSDNIYLFRALTEGNIEDRNNGIREIKPNSVREYEKIGYYREYDNNSKLTLEELYKHIRIQYRHCYTNCVSLTEDANVALTYNPENERYVMVCIPKKYNEKLIDVREFFIQELSRIVNGSNIKGNPKIQKLFLDIEQAKSNEELRSILRETNEYITSFFISDRQYLSKKEELEYHKILAKIKILEDNNIISNIVDSVDNDRLYSAIGNAFTSAEYIHYGTIEEENIIDCNKTYMDIFSLIQQAKFNGINQQTIERITNKVIQLMKNGYEITNSNIAEEDKMFLTRQYSKKQLLNDELSIQKAYEFTEGLISYTDTLMQITAIRSFAEAIIRKRILIDALKEAIPEEDIEYIFKDTYCLNPEFAIKQSGRGNQISNSVNIIVSENGKDLDNEAIRKILNKISNFSREQLEDIFNNGVNSKVLQELLIKTREENKRIEQYKGKHKKIKYIAEAIVERYDWKKVRGALTKAEKSALAKAITKGVKGDELERLYNTLQQIEIEGSKLSQQEILAVIINLAIYNRLEKYGYKKLLKLPQTEQSKKLIEIANSLQTEVAPISLNLLMKRDKTIEELKQSLIKLGISEEFIDQKDMLNEYTAKRVVERYNWKKAIGRKLKNREMGAIIQSILDNHQLNQECTCYLMCLIKKLEKKGLTENDIYGIIINLAINESVNDRSYAKMINGMIKMDNMDFSEKDTRVSEITIIRALAETMNEEEKEILKASLKKMGVPEDYIEKSDIRNLYILKEIVNNYNWEKVIGRKLEDEEKKSIIYSFSTNYLLITLMHKLEEKQISQQEIYAVIINLGINGTLDKTKQYNYTHLSDGTLGVDELELTEEHKVVRNSTILKANSKTIDEEELVKSLTQMGISKEFLEGKNIQNLYIAKRIVENYDWKRTIGRNLEIEEKTAIIKKIMRNSLLNKGRTVFLSSLVQKLEMRGNDEQETYGIIINLAINGGLKDKIGYDYTSILSGTVCIDELELTEEDKKVSNISILKAMSETVDKKGQERIIQLLVQLGISNEFLIKKPIENVYIAKEMIEKYDWKRVIGRSLEKEEMKLIMQSVLFPAELNKGTGLVLINLVKKLERKGLNEQEIYGTIINFAINSKYGCNCNYTSMIHGKIDIDQLLLTNADKNVSELGILRLKSETMEEDKKTDLKQTLIKMGISKELIDKKDIRNIYIVKKIVERYDWEKIIGRKIDAKEECDLLNILLSNNILNKGRIRNLIRKLEDKGLNEQEIYGLILNLGINGCLNGKKGCSYSNMINGMIDIEKLELSGEDKKVTMCTMLKMKSETIDEEEQERLKQSMINLGIPEEFLNQKNIRNIYISKEIVERYNWEKALGRKIGDEEKKDVIQLILSYNELDRLLLINLIRKLELKEINEQEIYGVIINLAIKGMLNNNRKHRYGYLLRGNVKTEELELTPEDITVTEETLIKAKQDIEKLMKKLLVKSKNSGTLSQIEPTLRGLIELNPDKDKSKCQRGRGILTHCFS